MQTFGGDEYIWLDSGDAVIGVCIYPKLIQLYT